MRGGLALDRAARYTSADFPTSGAEGAQQCERGAPMARQFIYHMQGLSKTYPGNRKILEDINLSFYPDAKIGVLGVNGSGKSTLLRIMAGIDTEFAGEAWAAEGARSCPRRAAAPAADNRPARLRPPRPRRRTPCRGRP